ncbi:hypothetical protein EI94DRAFT_1745553 [Lactarius quietus]|nr:hypothetical protein EI94DRAFT_1745553 [Lactarius quietus]
MSESCGNLFLRQERKAQIDTSRICVKCKTNTGNLVIRHSVYCKDCFTLLVTTKFRQSLEPHINHVPSGPRRGTLKPSGGLLIGFSGGLGSTVLLDSSEDLKGGKEHPRKNKMNDRTEKIREAAARYEGFEFVPVRMQNAFDRAWWERCTDAFNFDLAGGATGSMLLLYTAYSVGASHLVLGTSLTSLSISLISSIAQGGGFVVPQTIQEEWVPSFVERVPEDSSWNGEVRLIRPLRDVSMKECQAWVWWRQLPVVGKQRRDYPSTVSTIAKTAGKLAPKGESGERCILCELPTQPSVRGWKARTSIRSFSDGSSPVDDASSLSHLCYSCHTTLTSKSSRSTATPSWNSSDTLSEVHLPMWAAEQSASGRSDGQNIDPANTKEVWETKKLTADGMKSVVGGFLLE